MLLTDEDSFTEGKTYYKKPQMNLRLQNVYVDTIDVGGGTVNARIGETDDYIDYPKLELFNYINFGCYNNTP